MRQRIFTLAFAALPIFAGIAIAGVKIARADVNGTCIYNAIVAPIAGYPTLPACTQGRSVSTNYTDSAGQNLKLTGAWNADANNVVTNAFPVASAGLGFNGTSWDRLRSGSTNGDGFGTLSLGVRTSMAFQYGFNGTSFDRLREKGGSLQITRSGAGRTKVVQTTCTSATASPGLLATVVAAGTETSSVQVYDEGASPTCSSNDLIYNKVPPNGNADVPDIPTVNGIAFKLSAAAAVNDYITYQ